MKVGVNLINFGPGTSPQSLKRWVQLSENLGYHLMMTSDHIGITPDVQARYPAPFYEPLTTLGWMAGITEKMEVGTTVIIAPYRNVLELARACANVDQLSGGRFILGVGIGWAQQEFQALGVPFKNRGAITNEVLEAIALLWTQDVATYEGRFVSFQDVNTGPRPARSPKPPIWVGGASDQALYLRRVAAFTVRTKDLVSSLRCWAASALLSCDWDTVRSFHEVLYPRFRSSHHSQTLGFSTPLRCPIFPDGLQRGPYVGPTSSGGGSGSRSGRQRWKDWASVVQRRRQPLKHCKRKRSTSLIASIASIAM